MYEKRKLLSVLDLGTIIESRIANRIANNTRSKAYVIQRYSAVYRSYSFYILASSPAHGTGALLYLVGEAVGEFVRTK